MPEKRFSLTRVFPYKDKIFDSILIRENMGQRKPMFWYVFRSDSFDDDRLANHWVFQIPLITGKLIAH